MVDLVAATRRHAQLQLGASPRASVALYRAAQAWAYLDGRDFVLPDDVRAVAPAVLPHRLTIDLDQGLRGATPEKVVEELLGSVPVPPVVGTDGPPPVGAAVAAPPGAPVAPPVPAPDLAADGNLRYRPHPLGSTPPNEPER